MLRRISKSSLCSGDGERLVFRELDRRTPFLFKRSEALDEGDEDLERERDDTAPLTDLLLADLLNYMLNLMNLNPFYDINESRNLY